MKPNTENIKPNDWLIRLTGIPAFGILIPILTGLARKNEPWTFQCLQYGWFILIAAIIWQGNRFLLFRLRQKSSWFSRPFPKIISLIAANLLFTIPVSLLMLHGWYRLIANAKPDTQVIFQATLLIIISVLFVTQVYETVFLTRLTENERLRSEQLERAKAEAELDALRNQVDPHFMFNSLNTLSHLIATDVPAALRFNDDLADVYRYILSQHKQTLVPVSEEIGFLKTYFSLLRIRFGETVFIHFNIPDEILACALPPLSLQVLVENAVKHNSFSELKPLEIMVKAAADSITVSHLRFRKNHEVKGPGTGLRNLSERCRLITGRAIETLISENEFAVTVPLQPAKT